MSELTLTARMKEQIVDLVEEQVEKRHAESINLEDAKLIVNGNTTILIVGDEKYVARCKDEEFDLEKAVMALLVKRERYTRGSIKRLMDRAVYQEKKVNYFEKALKGMTKALENSVDILKENCDYVKNLTPVQRYLYDKGYKPGDMFIDCDDALHKITPTRTIEHFWNTAWIGTKANEVTVRYFKRYWEPIRRVYND